jgi:arylsulfatase A-like enzyme
MSEKSPNVLWICTDQQRFDTLGCYENPYIDTPNLDKLAGEGILFEKAYCQSPVCTPSRASFMTGRYPRTTRCRQNGQMIPSEERLISKILAEKGYYCGLSGKLHLAPCSPEICNISENRIDDGFCEYHWSHHPAGVGTGGIPESGGCNWPGNEYSRWLYKKGVPFERTNYDKKGYVQIGVAEPYHQTTWCAECAGEWIEYAAAYPDCPPWFYIINLFDPHHAFDPPSDLLEKYLAREDTLPLPSYLPGELDGKPLFQKLDHAGAYNVPHQYEYDAMTEDDHRLVKAAYYAMIELVDHAVGRLMDCLKRNGLIENTIVIFCSDHGEMLGDHGIYLKGPYFYEGMSHVPLIMSWPGHFPAGTRSGALVELVDIVPTIAELCVGKIEPGIQGRSLVPLTHGASSALHRSSVYCEYYNAMPWHDDPKAFATMVFNGHFKLCRYHGLAGELYDLEKDPLERKNLWDNADYSAWKSELLVEMTDRMAQTVDPLPIRPAKW